MFLIVSCLALLISIVNNQVLSSSSEFAQADQISKLDLLESKLNSLADTVAKLESSNKCYKRRAYCQVSAIVG